MKILYFAWLKNKTGKSKEYINKNKKLKKDDEIAIFPPVSGG